MTTKYIISPIVCRSYVFSEDTSLENLDGYIASKGAMLYTWENSEKASWSIRATADYDTRLYRNKLGLKVNLFSSYSQEPVYSGTGMISLGRWNSSIGLSANYNPSRTITLNNQARADYDHSAGIDNGTILSSRICISDRFLFRWALRPRLRWEMNYNITVYDYIHGYGKNNAIGYLNMSLTSALLKDASLELSVSGNNLFNFIANYDTRINALSMSQTWHPTYGQYGLLSIKYHFRKKQ